MMMVIIVTRIKITGGALINQKRLLQLNRKIGLTWTVVLWLVMVNLEEYNSLAATFDPHYQQEHFYRSASSSTFLS